MLSRLFSRVKFFLLGAVRSEASVSAYRRPLGYQQISSGTLASATSLTIPTSTAALNTNVATGAPNAPPLSGTIAGYAIIQCEGSSAGVRWRDDGTAPTASVGMILSSGQELDYSGDLTAIQFIVQTGSPALNISYYS